MADANLITVYLTKRANRPNYFMWYRDPVTEKQILRSTGKSLKRDAQRVAQAWELELRSGVDQNKALISWEDFREQFETIHLPSLAEGSRPTYVCAMNHLERIIAPARLSSVTALQLDKLAAALRAEGMKESTIKNRIRHLGSILNWAYEKDFIPMKIKLPKCPQAFTDEMKGRPLVHEEYERMLAACV